MLLIVLLISLIFIHLQNYVIHIVPNKHNAWPHKNVILQKQSIVIYDETFTYRDQKIISDEFLNFRHLMENMCKQLDYAIHHKDLTSIDSIFNDMSKLLLNVTHVFHDKCEYFKHSISIHIKKYTV